MIEYNEFIGQDESRLKQYHRRIKFFEDVEQSILFGMPVDVPSQGQRMAFYDVSGNPMRQEMSGFARHMS